MIYARYLKFLKSLVTNRRPALTFLLAIVMETRRSWTGQNVRKIVTDTGVTVVPGVTKAHDLADYRVYKTPVGEEHRLPLLVSLLHIRDSSWGVNYDDEKDQLNEDEVTAMINDVCVH